MQLLLWATSNLYVSVPLLVVAIFILRELLFASIKRFYIVYYALLFPGVVLHEFAHLLACILVGAKVTDVEFFSPTGGHVTHLKPKLKKIGTFVISLFPLIIGTLLIILLLPYIKSDDLSVLGIFLKVIIFYLLTTVTITMFPSSKDFSNAWFLYIIIAASTLTASYFLKIPNIYGREIIYFLLSCLAIVALANLIFLIMRKFFRR